MVGGYSGQDKSEKAGLYKCVPNMIGDKFQLNSLNKVCTRAKASVNGGNIASENSQKHRNGNYKWVKHHCNDFGKNQIIVCVV